MFRKSETEKRGGSARCVVHGSVQKVGAEEILRKFKFTDSLASRFWRLTYVLLFGN